MTLIMMKSLMLKKLKGKYKTKEIKMNTELNYTIFKLKKSLRSALRLRLNGQNNSSPDWDWFFDQWRDIVSPLFSNCDNIIEGIRIIDPLFTRIELDEERKEAEDDFYFILSRIENTPECLPRSELTDALILFYWRMLTGIFYRSLDDLREEKNPVY